MQIKHLILSAIQFFIYCSLYAQADITIDFKKLQPEYKFTINHKSSQKIIIENLNRKVYAVEESKVEKDFNITVPGAISGIKLPSFLFMSGLPQPQGSMSAQSPFPKKFADEDVNPQTAIPAYFAEIARRSKKLDQAAFLFNKITNLSGDCSNTHDVIKKELNERTDIYLNNTPSNPALSQQELYDRLKDSLYEMRKGAEEIMQHLVILIEAYTSTIRTQLDDELVNAEQQLEIEKKKLSNKKLSKTRIEEIKKEIAFREAELKAKPKEIGRFEEKVKTLEKNMEKAAEAIKEMYAFEKEDKPEALLKLYTLLYHSNSFSYTAILPKAKKDRITYRFTITPKETNICTDADKKQIEVEFNTRGGWKVDFSTGAFVNFGSEDFLGRTYYYKNLSDTARQIVSAERGSRLMLSVGALVHFYKRSTGCVKAGGSVGVSTTADFATLNFHAGPSLIFGKENRIILSAGLTLKTSSVLDRQLEMNKTYSIKETPDDIPVVSIFPKAGAFVSLTYNLSKFSKE